VDVRLDRSRAEAGLTEPGNALVGVYPQVAEILVLEPQGLNAGDLHCEYLPGVSV
jgi:hypothetical protein